MPNWVYNGLTVEGNADEVTRMVAQLNSPFSRVHDSWNPATNQHEKKTVTYPNPVFAFWNIIKPTNLDEYDKPSQGTQMQNPLGWYNWNLSNWGVKWDVCVSSDEKYPDTYMEGPVQNGDNLVVYYNFNTAWGIPGQALTNLSSQYPSLLFTLSYEEETGWGGEIEILRGEVISQSEYGWMCKECDHKEEETPWCDDCEFDICPSCGYNESSEPCDEHKEIDND